MLALARPKSPGFGGLGLFEIVSRAVKDGSGLAPAGFGPSRGFVVPSDCKLSLDRFESERAVKKTLTVLLFIFVIILKP